MLSSLHKVFCSMRSDFWVSIPGGSGFSVLFPRAPRKWELRFYATKKASRKSQQFNVCVYMGKGSERARERRHGGEVGMGGRIHTEALKEFWWKAENRDWINRGAHKGVQGPQVYLLVTIYTSDLNPGRADVWARGLCNQEALVKAWKDDSAVKRTSSLPPSFSLPHSPTYSITGLAGHPVWFSAPISGDPLASQDTCMHVVCMNSPRNIHINTFVCLKKSHSMWSAWLLSWV